MGGKKKDTHKHTHIPSEPSWVKEGYSPPAWPALFREQRSFWPGSGEQKLWMQGAERGVGVKKKEERKGSNTHSCAVRSLLCKAFMLQRKVLLREGGGEQNAGKANKQTRCRARYEGPGTLQQHQHRLQTQKLLRKPDDTIGT